MIILVDIGNSRLKWGIEDKGLIQFQGAYNYRQNDFSQRITESWKGLNKPEKIAISSVSSEQLVEMLQTIACHIWPEVEIDIPVSCKLNFGVSNAYRQAEKLGVDRWLNLLALHRYYPGDACVIDCGTAITMDFLNAQGQHLGGLISPGLRLMKKSLLQGTEELQFSEGDFEPGLADSTEAAIYSGTLFSAVGLIEYVLNKQCLEQQLILTGGDAEVISEQLRYEAIIEADMVLKGLAIYCKGG